jgi:hypothetical protein
VRSAGARFAAPLAAFLIMLAVGHNLFAQLLSIARYYT